MEKEERGALHWIIGGMALFIAGGAMGVMMTAPDLQKWAYQKGLNDGYWNGQAKGCVEKAIYDDWRENHIPKE